MRYAVHGERPQPLVENYGPPAGFEVYTQEMVGTWKRPNVWKARI